MQNVNVLLNLSLTTCCEIKKSGIVTQKQKVYSDLYPAMI